MILKIVEYDFKHNDCKAVTADGNIVDIDPFVACAVEMTDEEYYTGAGFNIVGKTYTLPDSVFVSDGIICPGIGEMIEA